MRHLFMHARKHSVGRNILRVFEIALFFAVSVLGYGLMVKASSFSARSKTRVQASGIQTTPGQKGNRRELSVTPCNLIVPNETANSASHSGVARAIEAVHASQFAAMLSAVHEPSHQYQTNPARTPFPHNLLQQNPVLLI